MQKMSKYVQISTIFFLSKETVLLQRLEFCLTTSIIRVIYLNLKGSFFYFYPYLLTEQWPTKKAAFKNISFKLYYISIAFISGFFFVLTCIGESIISFNSNNSVGLKLFLFNSSDLVASLLKTCKVKQHSNIFHNSGMGSLLSGLCSSVNAG